MRDAATPIGLYHTQLESLSSDVHFQQDRDAEVLVLSNYWVIRIPESKQTVNGLLTVD